MANFEGVSLGGVPADLTPDQRRKARAKHIVRITRRGGESIAGARRRALSVIRNREAKEIPPHLR
ncbi:MAG: hypothetical protein V4449_04010 [Patescibacteria group bacterium]